YGRHVRQLAHETQSALGSATRVAEERLGDYLIVRAYGAERYESLLFDSWLHRVYTLACRDALASGIFFSGAALSGNLMILAVFGLGGRLVMDGALTVGDISSFLMYTAYIGAAVTKLSSVFAEFIKGVGSSRRIFELVDRSIEVPLDVGCVLKPFQG